MAVQTKVSTFVLAAAPGPQSITGVGIGRPDAIVFWVQDAIAGATNEVRHSIGAATGPANRWCVARGFLGGASGFAGVLTTNLRCICLIDSGTSAEVQGADFTQFDADGFTINVTTGGAKTIHYWAISGVSAQAGTFDAPATGTPTIPVTGMTFAPKANMFCVGGKDATNTGIGPDAGSIGWALSAANQFYCSSHIDATPSQAQSLLTSAGHCFGSQDGSGATNFQGDFVSNNADGFTVKINVDPFTVATRVGYLSLGGNVLVDLRSITEPAAIGSQATTGVGHAPNGIMLVSAGGPTNLSNFAGVQPGIGAASGTAAQGSSAYNEPNGSVSAAQPVGVDSTSAALILSGTAAATTSARAVLTAFGSDGYTLNWTAVDGLLSEVKVFSIGSALSTATLAWTEENDSWAINALAAGPAGKQNLGAAGGGKRDYVPVRRTALSGGKMRWDRSKFPVEKYGEDPLPTLVEDVARQLYPPPPPPPVLAPNEVNGLLVPPPAIPRNLSLPLRDPDDDLIAILLLS